MVPRVVGTQDQDALSLSPQPVLQPLLAPSDPGLEDEMPMGEEGCLALSCLASEPPGLTCPAASFSCSPSL